MMTWKWWPVVVVDDDDSVHQITEITLKRMEFFGVPVKLFHCQSAKEAKELLSNRAGSLGWSAAVAIVDVVMETDHAGLDLCRFIRGELGNHVAQLVLRTGQPGVAPPRTVIDEFNINYYLNKSEVTADGLYLVMKAAIQQFFNMHLMVSAAWRADIFRAFSEMPSGRQEFIDRVFRVTFRSPAFDTNIAFDFGDQYLGLGRFRDRRVYDGACQQIMVQAQALLLSSRYTLATPTSPNRAIPRSAVVDDYMVVEVRPTGKYKRARLLLESPTYPRDLEHFYGFLWAQELAQLASSLMFVAEDPADSR